jgi:hypothetical protein
MPPPQATSVRLGPSPDTAASDLAAIATIASAGATVTAAAATALAPAAITLDPVETLSFARVLAAADAAAALTLDPLAFQGAYREAWTATHKPV